MPDREPRRARRAARALPGAASPFLIAALAACPIGGCGEADGIRTYEVRTEDAPAAPPHPTPSHPTPPTHPTHPTHPTPPTSQAEAAPAPAVDAAAEEPWTVPDGWRRIPGERAMRLATFETGEGAEVVEVVVSRFPGNVGGLLANVNRWRGQVGLGPVGEEELAAILTPFEGGSGFRGYTMRLEGPESHMLAAILEEAGADRTWFVKAVAAPEVADRHEEEVFAFARSFGNAGGGDEDEGGAGGGAKGGAGGGM